MNMFDDNVVICAYCRDEASEAVQKLGCCGEQQFISGREINAGLKAFADAMAEYKAKQLT